MAGPDRKEVIDAIGKQWDYVLSLFVHPDFLDTERKEGPCPVCGGSTRFRYDNKYGRGDSYCSHCGNRDGLQLIQEVTGWNFPKTLEEIMLKLRGGAVTVTLPKPKPIAKQKKASSAWIKGELNKLWKGGTGITTGDSVDTYFRNRGLILPSYPGVMRYHPAMEYFEDAKKEKIFRGTYEGFICVVQDKDGTPVTLHRTYLQDGAKLQLLGAEGKELPAKMLFSSVGEGGAIRLFAGNGNKLGVCEGVEKGFAIHLMTGLDMWVGISAQIMKKMWIPPHIDEVYLFSDHDLPDERGRRAGQDATIALKNRLLAEGRKTVKAYVPRIPGTDFHHYYLMKQAQAGNLRVA